MRPFGGGRPRAQQPTSIPLRLSDHIRQRVEDALFADQDSGLAADNRSSSQLLVTSQLHESYKQAFAHVVIVGVGFQVVRIHQLDDVGETFTLDFDMHMTWRDPGLVDVKEPDWEKAWSPTIIFRNEISVELISSRCFVTDPRNGTVFCYRKYTATFYEILELEYFPFDRQILHIDISSFRSTRELKFVQFSDRQNKVFAMPISMWDIQTAAEDGGRMSIRHAQASGKGQLRYYAAPDIVVTDNAELLAAADGLTYPRARFEIEMERRCECYLWNVILVTWAIVMLSAVVMLIPREDVSEKMSINVTLVLTIMAFKFTFSGDLPKKAYLTWMDKYLIAAFSVLMLQALTVWLGAVLPSDSRLLPVVEIWVPSGYYALWTAYHVRMALFTSHMYPSWEHIRANQRVQIII